MIIGIIAGIVIAVGVAGVVFVNQPQFGRIPQGERLERIKKSPHYKEGQFRNLHATPMMTSGRGRWGLYGILFSRKRRGYAHKRKSPPLRRIWKA